MVDCGGGMVGSGLFGCFCYGFVGFLVGFVLFFVFCYFFLDFGFLVLVGFGGQRAVVAW